MAIESVMSSNHLILCLPLLLPWVLALLAASLQGPRPLLPTPVDRVPREVGLLHVHKGRGSEAVTSVHQQHIPRLSHPACVKEVLFACLLIEVNF